MRTQEPRDPVVEAQESQGLPVMEAQLPKDAKGGGLGT